VNLLLANGHPAASRYPIGQVFDEAKLVVERRNGELATLGLLVQAATATTSMGASKKTGEHFQDLIKGLSGEQ
jgi:hypothetical protein